MLFMKSLILGFWLAVSVAATSCLFADTPASQPVAVNKKCPISGDDVNPKAKTATYKDQTIGFCCDDCVSLFNKNPDKYADKIK